MAKPTSAGCALSGTRFIPAWWPDPQRRLPQHRREHDRGHQRTPRSSLHRSKPRPPEDESSGDSPAVRAASRLRLSPVKLLHWPMPRRVLPAGPADSGIFAHLRLRVWGLDYFSTSRQRQRGQTPPLRCGLATILTTSPIADLTRAARGNTGSRGQHRPMTPKQVPHRARAISSDGKPAQAWSSEARQWSGGFFPRDDPLTARKPENISALFTDTLPGGGSRQRWHQSSATSPWRVKSSTGHQ